MCSNGSRVWLYLSSAKTWTFFLHRHPDISNMSYAYSIPFVEDSCVTFKKPVSIINHDNNDCPSSLCAVFYKTKKNEKQNTYTSSNHNGWKQYKFVRLLWAERASAQRMQPAARFGKINSGACGRMLTGSLLALQTAAGNLSRQRGHSLQQLPDCTSLHALAHTHTQNAAALLASSTWPLLEAERVFSRRDSPPGDAPGLPTCLAARSWPMSSITCCDLCPAHRGEKQSSLGTTPSI